MQAKPKPTRSSLKLSKLEAEDSPPFSFWTLPILGASPSLDFSPFPPKVGFFPLLSPSFSFEHVHDGRLRLEPLLLAPLLVPDIVENYLCEGCQKYQIQKTRFCEETCIWGQNKTRKLINTFIGEQKHAREFECACPLIWIATKL